MARFPVTGYPENERTTEEKAIVQLWNKNEVAGACDYALALGRAVWDTTNCKMLLA